MNEQKIFDKVVKHFRQQKVAATTAYGACRYRTADGKSCAVGCLIPARNYDESLEGSSISSYGVMEALPKGYREHESLLVKLQSIHDSAAFYPRRSLLTSETSRRLKNLAVEKGLKDTEVTW